MTVLGRSDTMPTPTSVSILGQRGMLGRSQGRVICQSLRFRGGRVPGRRDLVSCG